MNKTNQNRTDYSPYLDAFDLEQGFLENPLMACIKLARYKFVAKMLSRNDVVLDLGCGNGLSSYFFSKSCKKVIGMDAYTDISAIGKKMTSNNLNFVKHDILKPPPPDILQEKISVITAIDVIEHFYRDDAEVIIQAHSQLIPKNGMMIIGTPNKHSRKYRSKKSKDSHFYEYEPEELREICGKFFGRTLLFSMNDEVVHTGFDKLAWFFYVLAIK